MALPTCPNCGAQLFPHELKNGECTSCMTKLPANITAEAAPEPEWRGAPDRDRDPIIRRDAPRDYYDEPSGYDRPTPGEYGTVRAGVNMVRWGMGILLALGVILQVMGFALTSAAAGGGMGRDAVQMIGCVSIILGLTALGCALVVFLGVCFCCTVPPQSQGSGWARGLIVCMVLVVVLAILTAGVYFGAVAGAMNGRGVPEAMLPLLLLVGGGLLLVLFGANLCFYMLLRGVALDFRDQGLAGGFVAYFITSLLVGIFTTGVYFYVRMVYIPEMLQNAFRQGGGRGGFDDAVMVLNVVGCAQMVVGVALGIWLLTLLSRLYNLIGYGGSARRSSYGGSW